MMEQTKAGESEWEPLEDVATRLTNEVGLGIEQARAILLLMLRGMSWDDAWKEAVSVAEKPIIEDDA